MRRVLLGAAAVVVAVPLIAVVAVSVLLDGDAIKGRLADQVRRATGRELSIAGPVTLAWSFAPTLALADVSLGNPPGFPTPQLAHADRIEARIALSALWRRQIEIERIAVVSPSIRLERDGAGRGNWVFAPPSVPVSSPSPTSAPSGPRFTLSVGAVEIDAATIAWGDRVLTAPHLAYDPRDGAVTGSIAVAGTTAALSGRVGPFAAAPYPVALRLAGPGVTASLDGTSAAATLTAGAADLAALSPLFGRALPSLHDVSVSVALPGPGAIRAEMGSVMLGRVSLRAATLTAASLTDPATITASGTLGSSPFELLGHLGSVAALGRTPTPVDARLQLPGSTAALKGALSLQPGAAALAGFRLEAEQGDLSGDLSLGYGGRPSLVGTLTSTRLDLDGLAAAPSPPSPPSAAPAPPSPPGRSPPVPPSDSAARIIPDVPLRLASLRDGDADVQLTVGSLRVSGATLNDVRAHAVLADGTLRIDPASTAIGGVPARGTLTATAAPPRLQVTVDAPGLPLGGAMALVGGSPDVTGTLDIRADLGGTGDTLRAVAATLSGHLGIALADGQIDNALLERLAAGTLRAAGVSFADGGRTAIRCAAVRAEATGGQVRLPMVALDTTRLSLDGSGEVDLGSEAVDLHLRPQLRLGGGLSVPLRVRGTLATPRAQLDPGAIASGRVGFLLGGGPPPDTCGPALAAARGDEAAPAPRPAKPANLLKELLR